MRLEIEVDLKTRKNNSGRQQHESASLASNRSHRTSEERRLRRIALARAIFAAISRGEFVDMADVARQCGVSRARISHVMDPNRNPPDAEGSLHDLASRTIQG